MLIVCPACDARYAVDDALIGAGGRAVRCSGCHAEWTIWRREAAPAWPTDARGPEAPAPRDPAAPADRPPAGPAALGDAERGAASGGPGAERAGAQDFQPDLRSRGRASRDRSLAATLESPPARRGGDGFLAGFLLATTASLCAALVYLRADDIVAAAPSVAPQIEAYRVWVDARRADVAAALAQVD